MNRGQRLTGFGRSLATGGSRVAKMLLESPVLPTEMFHHVLQLVLTDLRLLQQHWHLALQLRQNPRQFVRFLTEQTVIYIAHTKWLATTVVFVGKSVRGTRSSGRIIIIIIIIIGSRRQRKSVASTRSAHDGKSWTCSLFWPWTQWIICYVQSDRPSI